MMFAVNYPQNYKFFLKCANKIEKACGMKAYGDRGEEGAFFLAYMRIIAYLCELINENQDFYGTLEFLANTWSGIPGG